MAEVEEVCERIMMQGFLRGREKRVNEEEEGLEWRFRVRVGVFGFGHIEMARP